MYDKGVITIQNFQKGMADSAYLGFSNIANCDVFTTPGISKIANRLAPKTSLTLSGTPIAYVEDSFGNYYFLTSNGALYKNQTLINSNVGGNCWDLAIYNDYLIVSHSSVLSVYGPLSSGGAQYFANWKTGMSSVYYRKLVPSLNGDLFIGNGENMAKVTEFVAGAVGVAPTATFNASVMEMPVHQAITTFVELGTYMIIGTQEENGSYFNGTNGSLANLYLWDKSDTKVTSLIASLNEASVQSMIVYGGRAFVCAGVRGNVYVTDTASTGKVRRIPWNQNQSFSSTLRIYPNAMAVNNQGNILIGTSTFGDSFNSDQPSKHGVYEMVVQEGYPTVFKNQVSSGGTGATTNLEIGFVTARNIATVGWRDGATFGLDNETFQLYENAAVIESKIVQVAPRLNRKTFQNVEFLLGRPLTSGQEIKISYRKNRIEDYTEIGTFTFATLGAVISHNTSALIKDAELVQIKVEMTQPAGSVFGTNIELIAITIW